MDDQYEREHATDYQADDDAMEVLRAVAEMVRGAKHLVIVGPYDDQSICEVQFTHPDDEKLAPTEPVRIAVRGEDREIVIRVSPRSPPVPFSGAVATTSPHAPPQPPTGRSMGGDAIWQAAQDEHGTAAFYANSMSVSTTKAAGVTVQNAMLSCRHVLAGTADVDEGERVSMVLRTNELVLAKKLDWPVDAACATVDDPNDYLPCQIRALGKIQGVRWSHRNMRVYKYGARSGLTAGRVGRFLLYAMNQATVRAFQVGGQFACVHDSGAAVINNRRELVGIVFEGAADCTMTHVLAAAPYGSNISGNALFIQYS